MRAPAHASSSSSPSFPIFLPLWVARLKSSLWLLTWTRSRRGWAFFFERGRSLRVWVCAAASSSLSFPPLVALALQNELARRARSCVLGLLPPRSYWPGPRRRRPPLTTAHSSCLCIPHRPPPPSAPLRSVETRGKRGSSFPPGGCMKHQKREKGGREGAAIYIFIFE